MKSFLVFFCCFIFLASGINAQASKTQPLKLKTSGYETAVPADTNKVQTAETKISGRELVGLIDSAPENFKGAKVLFYNGHQDTSAIHTDYLGYVIFVLQSKNAPELVIKVLDSPYVLYDFDPKKWHIVDPFKGYE